MKTSTLTDFRKNIKARLDETFDNHDILVINRKDNRDMVLLSLEDYESLKETAYLMSTKANANHIVESLDQANKGQLINKTLTELGIE